MTEIDKILENLCSLKIELDITDLDIPDPLFNNVLLCDDLKDIDDLVFFG